jgi:predicted O-methyltransferase YrrM
MLHLFLTDYFLREQSYQRYEFFNYELAKWAEFYLKKYTTVHQSNWCAGKVTENPNDILLGHPTWDNVEQAQQLGMGKFLRDWVKDNALDPSQPCHPNTYILMPWVPEFPSEWMPNLIHLESQLLSARKIFALCGNLWFERTLAKQDNSIQARVKHKLIKVNIGIALENFPITKNRFNPIGSRQLLHISTLGSYKGFDITCESIQGLNTLLNVASKSLDAPIGLIDAKWTNGKTYTFNFLGSINNNDPQFNQWVVDTCDFYIHTGTMDAQATVILENSARGLIPLVTPESGFDCPHAIYLTLDPEKNREIIQDALHMPSEELLERSYLIREYLKTEHSWQKTFDTIWQEIQKDIYQRQLRFANKQIPKNDYVSPNLEVILVDQHFPNVIIGDTNNCRWLYLRREIPHNWYVDREFPMVGLLNRDEAHILYNSALQFRGKKALEIGCWVGWSTVHLALAGVNLDVVDPMLDHPVIGARVRASLRSANLENNVSLYTGLSPAQVAEIYQQTQQKWSLIFIDGDHAQPAPLRDAIVADRFAEESALILFHDLACPDVAEGLAYLQARGWQVMVYQTMQIMGVAWRGKVAPIQHIPDPKVKWQLPSHLKGCSISGMEPIFDPLPSKSVTGFYSLVSALRYTDKLPLVSVIIPCFNQGKFLAEAVASVVCQTYEHWEIIIVNDGSSDNTSEIAKQLIALYPSASILLVEQENRGTASARNHGIRFAKGEYILPLDADDRLTNYAIEALLENALQCGETCVSFGSFRTFNNSSLLTISVDLYTPAMISQSNPLCCVALFPKKVWELVGGYKDDMTQGNEDWEFWVNCHRHKIKFVGIPELVLHYRRYQDSRHELAQEQFLLLLSQMVVHNPEMYAPEMVRTAIEVLEQQKPELPFAVTDNTLISFPDWDTFPEAIYEQLQDALLQIFRRSDSGKFTWLLITDHDASERADEILSEAVVNLLMRPEVDFQQEPQIHLVIASDLNQTQWKYLLSSVCGRVALECDNQGLIKELNADRLNIWHG